MCLEEQAQASKSLMMCSSLDFDRTAFAKLKHREELPKPEHITQQLL